MGGVRQRQRRSRPVARLFFRAVASGAIWTPLMPSTMPEDAVKYIASWCRHKTAELATACKTLPTLSYYFDIQVSRFSLAWR
jgi:hypothetical protein